MSWNYPSFRIIIEKNKKFKIEDLEKYNLLDDTELILVFKNDKINR